MRMSSLAFADSMRRHKTVPHAAMHRIDQRAQFSAEHGVLAAASGDPTQGRGLADRRRCDQGSRRDLGGTTRNLVNIVSPLS